MYHNKRSHKGFTLLEVLVSIAIFASLSAGAYQVLNQVQRSNEMSLQRSQRLDELQRALVIMDADFRQMIARQFRTDGNEPSSKLLFWEEKLLDSDQKGIMFVRLGWHNPLQQFPRGEIIKVGYRLSNETLERVWWRYPDTPTGQDGVISPLLSDIEAMEMQFYWDGSWSDDWSVELAIPEAVAIKLTLKDYGDIERIYLTSANQFDSEQAPVTH